MTENKAKEYMEDEIRCIQRAIYCDRDCAKCELVKEEEPLLEAFGIAIQALEKQIPKKPIRNDLCTCLSCGTYNEVIRKRRNTVAFDTVYCWHCGQAIEVKCD